MNQELAHDGGDGDAVALAAGPELLIERPQDRVAAGGGECRHIQRPAHVGPAATAVALDGGGATVAVEGRQTSAGGDAGAVELAPLGQRGERVDRVGPA